MCWICFYGQASGLPPVGVCVVCHVGVCPNHSNRGKGRLWCDICLGRVLLNTAGFPTVHLDDPSPDDYMPPYQVHALWEAVAPFRGEAVGVLDAARNAYRDSIDPAAALYPDVAELAFEVAVVLAVRSAGPDLMRAARDGVAGETVVDPRLAPLLQG